MLDILCILIIKQKGGVTKNDNFYKAIQCVILPTLHNPPFLSP